ncbi:MAG TPA: hypothetical protein EYN91_19180 [Candidatus Melainabacteria bacterium]|nr:hypothetical protein [Candidatus Melainabacteria bacterium]HIN66369.1 hypothetical protein [Candidatus Obscuribacterales bacterium]
MAEIQKPADQPEQKPDAALKRLDNLGKDRTVNNDQVTEAEAQRTNKFNTFGDMKAYADSNPLLIDMGDGTEVSSKGERVAWDPLKDVKTKTGEAVGFVRDKTEQLVFPLRGKEDTQVHYTACAAAYAAFPEFARHPNIDRALIPALIRNELHFYSDAKEKPVEGILNVFGDLPKESLSIGPAQIQKQNIERLMQSYPQLNDPELGNIAGNPLRAALNPEKAPWFVAALLAENISRREASGLPITHQALIQDYNPGGKAHFNHVHEQLIWIKSHHAGW